MNIYRVSGRFANSYIVEEGNRFFVVDVPFRGEKYVTGFIKDVLGEDITKVDLVVSTHDDADHSGGIHGLARECDAAVGLPYASYALVKKIWHNPLGLFFRSFTVIKELFRPRMWKMYFNPYRRQRYRKKPTAFVQFPSRLDDRHIPPDYLLKDKQQLPGFPGWIVIHTPGHSWDSCCYFHTQTRSLISGDTLLGSEKGGGVLLPSVYANPRQMQASIRKLMIMNPSNIYPGHGSTFDGEGLLDHLEFRKA